MQRSQSDRNQLPVRSELAAALAACRGAFYGTAVISGMSNVLMLTGAMFMLEIYDRVLPSRSMPTLVGLLVLVAVLFTALGVLDAIRGRILVRIGGTIDETLSGRVYDALSNEPRTVVSVDGQRYDAQTRGLHCDADSSSRLQSARSPRSRVSRSVGRIESWMYTEYSDGRAVP